MADRTTEHAPRPALVLISEALLDPNLLLDVPPGRHDSVVAAIQKIGSVFIEARKLMHSGASPHEVLWSKL
jgi:hypothetical protein